VNTKETSNQPLPFVIKEARGFAHVSQHCKVRRLTLFIYLFHILQSASITTHALQKNQGFDALLTQTPQKKTWTEIVNKCLNNSDVHYL